MTCFLKITPKFGSTHNELQEISENTCFQCFVKHVNITCLLIP